MDYFSAQKERNAHEPSDMDESQKYAKWKSDTEFVLCDSKEDETLRKEKQN